MLFYRFFFFFKQKTAYEMRISDWSSDVCSSDLTVSKPFCRSWRQLSPDGRPRASRSRDFGLAHGRAGRPRAVAAVEVADVAPMLGEDSRSGVTALPDLAVHDERPVGQFLQPVTQFVDRDVDRLRDRAGGMLVLAADVDQSRTGVERGIELVPLDGSRGARAEIVCDVAELVDRVFRGTELRRVCELQSRQAGGGDSARHCDRDHVDALVDALTPYDLGTEDRIGGGLDEQLHRHRLRPRVVGGVRRRMGRSEEPTSELQSLMRNSYAVFCLKKKTTTN